MAEGLQFAIKRTLPAFFDKQINKGGQRETLSTLLSAVK